MNYNAKKKKYIGSGNVSHGMNDEPSAVWLFSDKFGKVTGDKISEAR